MEQRLTGLVQRRLTQVALDRFEDEPVLLLQGPRSVGKSTLLRQLADRLGADVVDLDDVATRDAVAADPATFVARPGVVCIDEYQHVPLVLDAIKAELNRDGRPGRFILTGSARHEALPVAAQALTGRLHRLPVYPLSQGEISGVEEGFLARVLDGDVPAVGPLPMERHDYIERVVAGGFPVPLSRPRGARRARWIDDYIRLTLERDVRELARVEQAAVLPRLLERLAGQTAQVLNIARAASDLRMSERTVDSYVRLLEAVFLVRRLPAWGTTLTARAGARPKVHMLDSGIAARLLRLTGEKLARRDPTALTELGHLLETFVVGELLKQASWLEGVAGIGHWRTRDGDEVDLVIERDDGAVVAFEVKASQRVDGRELAPLRKLRDAVGPSFLAGIALHLGAQSYAAEDRLYVVSAAALWSASEAD
ncbi:MAG: ATP-binding protein [Dehalococcoidia bacterium]|nr:ATP-binding protein [Dehalococcoidia bacterium]